MFKVGDRVRLTQDVERYPYFIAPAGTTGVVIHASKRQPSPSAGLTLTIRADRRIQGAEEWDNEIHWEYDDDPANDLEVIEDAPAFGLAARIRVTFSASDFPFSVIRAWSFGEHWNGWEVPYFEYREAKRVATALTQDGLVTIYDSPTDSFYSFTEDGSEPTQDDYNRLHDAELWYDWTPVTIETPEGPKKTWSIGGMAFTWELVPPTDSRLNEARQKRTRMAARTRYEILVRVPSRGIKNVLEFDGEADLYGYLQHLLQEVSDQFEEPLEEAADLMADLQEPFDERVVEAVLALANEDVYAQYEFLGAR